MFQYNRYNIKPELKFNADEFPRVQAEAMQLQAGIGALPPNFKAEIIISYLKDHSINHDWAGANPQLASLVTSGIISTTHMESLFESCRMNKPFRQQFEDYLKNSFA